MEQVALLSLVTGTLAFTLSETKLFAPCRDWARRRSALVGEMLSCGYCCGHWIALALVVVYQMRLFNAWWLLDYALTAIVIAGLAAFQWGALCLLLAKTGK
jgi:hypothetical protein